MALVLVSHGDKAVRDAVASILRRYADDPRRHRRRIRTPLSILRTSSPEVAKRLLSSFRHVQLVVTGASFPGYDSDESDHEMGAQGPLRDSPVEGLAIAAAAKRANRGTAVLMIDARTPISRKAVQCGVNKMLSLPLVPDAIAACARELLGNNATQ